MDESDTWFIARIGFVETMRAVALGAPKAVRRARAEWPELDVVEIDQPLVERAVDLAVEHRLRSSDAIHLAAALTLHPDELVFASWNDRLSAAAAAEGLALLPRAAV